MDSNMVSVVIPTYKRMGSTVEKAIKSVLSQTYKNIEILVIDDNGDNKSVFSRDIREMLLRYPSVVYIALPKNSGACVARNEGIRAAKGEYIGFLDDDDIWHTDKIEKQMLLMKGDVGFVYCGLDLHFEKDEKRVKKEAVIKKKPIECLLRKNYIGSTSCGLVKKSVAVESGMFDEKLKSGQDLDFWIRLIKTTKYDCVKDCLVEYTFYKSGTITRNYMNRLFSNIYIRKKYDSVFKKNVYLRILYRFKIVKAFFINRKIKEGLAYLFFGRVEKKYEI